MFNRTSVRMSEVAIMINRTQVPVDLFLTNELSASAKLVWLALSFDEHMDDSTRLSPTRLAERTGLSRPTIRTAIAQLKAAGWYALASGKSQQHKCLIIAIPEDLLTDSTLSSQAKVVYGALHAMAGFAYPNGKFSYVALGKLMHRSLKPIRNGVRQLVQAGWIDVKQANRQAPICFTIRNPFTAHGESELVRAQRRLEKAPYRGEALMREYLSLIVDSTDFEDNSAPGFLVNPLTDERMQLDRFYPHTVAFEFNGPQHYHPTEIYTAEDVCKQQARDYMKIGICLMRGITPIVIQPKDLSLQAMQKKVGELLPLRDLRGYEPLIDYLDLTSRSYKRAAMRGWTPAPTPSVASVAPPSDTPELMFDISSKSEGRTPSMSKL